MSSSTDGSSGTSASTSSGASSGGSTGVTVGSSGGGVGPLGQPCADPGELGCAGHAQKETTICNGGTWQPNGACPSGENCDTDRGPTQGLCLPIDPLCAGATPGSGICDDGGLVQCGVDLVSHSGPTPCVNQACLDGACAGVCAPGQVQCAGSGVQTCQASGQWSAAVACPAGEACKLDSCAPSCADSDACGGQGCVSGFCAPCTRDADCATGEVCDADGGRCVIGPSGCTTDAQCEIQYGSPDLKCDLGATPHACRLVASCSLPDGGRRFLTSNEGCDFWGTLTSNTALKSPFTAEDGGVSEYAFVVGNSSSETANVTVQSLGDGRSFSAAVAPGSVSTVKLPWLQICGTGEAQYGYHLASDMPVTVYQFNPLTSSLPANSSCTGSGLDGSCPGDGTEFCMNGACYYGAFTDDASLLLPSGLLGTSYVVVSTDHESKPSSNSELPGSFSVVATSNDTRVRIRFSGSALGSGTGTTGMCTGTQGEIASIDAGLTEQFALNAGDVLQFWTSSAGTKTCATSANSPETCLWSNDFTGSVVTSLPMLHGGAPKKIAVFGGADCTFKPYNQYACDHIEEEMLPYDTWGKTYVGAKSAPYAGATANPYPDFWRVISACGSTSCPSGATVTITPPIAGTIRSAQSCGAACTCTTTGPSTTCSLPPLADGGTAPWIEFQHDTSFVAQGDQPISLAQYFTGENEAGQTSDGTATATEGDPSLVLAPPVEQWRTAYTVLAPTSYQHNYANLMVNSQAATSQVSVDGTAVTSGWTQISGTNYWVNSFLLANAGSGSHTIVGANGTLVGVVIYGYDAYVSYGYTGGLDLQPFRQLDPGE